MNTRLRRLAPFVVAAAIAAVHAAVLGALPQWLPPISTTSGEPSPDKLEFETRSIFSPPALPSPQPTSSSRSTTIAAPPPRPAATPVEATDPPAPGSEDSRSTSEHAGDVEETVVAAAALPAASATPEASNAAELAKSQASDLKPTVQKAQPPSSVRLKYDVRGEIKGFSYFVNGDLLWINQGDRYNTKLEISHFLLGSRIQTSKGSLSEKGLEPVRFGDKVRSEVAAHFDRARGLVTYSANTPDEPLTPGAQDQLSVFFQIASLLAAAPSQYPAGFKFDFQTVGPKHSERWILEMGASESLNLPGGKISTVKIIKAPVSEYDSRAELWLAPDMDYLPVRIRLTQGNGDVVDQLWRATERPASPP